MNPQTMNMKIKLSVLSLLFVCITVFTGVIPALAHTPGQDKFTPFMATLLAIRHYDDLIDSKKLSSEWDTDLKAIKVSTRKILNILEYVVEFERTKGEPGSFFIFFTHDGLYSGSNFTGD